MPNGHRRTGEILRALFELVLRNPGMQRAQALRQLAPHLRPGEMARVDWGTVGADKVGWLERRPRGRWTITPEGAKAFRTYTDPEAFHRELDRRYREVMATSSSAPAPHDVAPPGRVTIHGFAPNKKTPRELSLDFDESGEDVFVRVAPPGGNGWGIWVSRGQLKELLASL